MLAQAEFLLLVRCNFLNLPASPVLGGSDLLYDFSSLMDLQRVLIFSFLVFVVRIDVTVSKLFIYETRN